MHLFPAFILSLMPHRLAFPCRQAQGARLLTLLACLCTLPGLWAGGAGETHPPAAGTAAGDSGLPRGWPESRAAAGLGVVAGTWDYPFQNPNLDIETRVTDLISRMELREKIQALSTRPDVPRLGVKGSDHVEGLHGLALGGPARWGGWNKQQLATTTFPQSVGLGQTWNPDLIRQVAGVEGWEARYIFNALDRGGLVIRSPNADLARDPRWGRSEESYGEDPFLTGSLSAAFVRGLQGDNPYYMLTASLMKHFLANSNEDNRGGSSSDFDQRFFHEYYAWPFRQGVEAGSRAYMTAYNAHNGIPMTAHPTIRQVTMEQWGLDGIVCTDAGAMAGMEREHHWSKNLVEAAAAAIKAGINQFLEEDRVYQPALRQALSQGLITEADLDQNLRGVYRVMIRLGLLDPPEAVPYASIGATRREGDPEVWELPAHKDLALKATLESIVLLKNQDGFLPLKAAGLKRLLVVGPWADWVLQDWYSGDSGYDSDPVTALTEYLGDAVQVDYVTGEDLEETLELARKADTVLVVEGNHPTGDAGWARVAKDSYGKEAVDRKSLDLESEALVKAIHAVNPRTVLVLQTSFPYAINWSQATLPAIVTLVHNSQETGTALVRVLFGDYNPAGRLVCTWPSSLDQVPAILEYDLSGGHTYLYSKEKPLYPFGYGLSYSAFTYGPASSDHQVLRPGETLGVKLDIVNTGARDGDEVVQVYVRRPDSAIRRPIRELRAFQRLGIPAGQTVQASLKIPADDLRHWDEKAGTWALEPGSLVLEIGASSQDIRQTLTLDIQS